MLPEQLKERRAQRNRGYVDFRLRSLSILGDISVTSILDPKKRKIRVKKRLYKREKKIFCARNPFKKREILKKWGGNVFYCIFINKFFINILLFKFLFAKKIKALKVAKKSVHLTPSKKNRRKNEVSKTERRDIRRDMNKKCDQN